MNIVFIVHNLRKQTNTCNQKQYLAGRLGCTKKVNDDDDDATVD